MASTSRATSKPQKKTVWDWLFGITFGTAFSLLWWTFAAVVVSILIEWIGMYFWWDVNHSAITLEQDISYLSARNAESILGYYPVDVAKHFLNSANNLINAIKIRELSDNLAQNASGIALILHYGIESIINVVFIFCVRLVICLTTVPGFIVVLFVALIDGLCEREIRKACGGIESSLIYHHAKRVIYPVVILSFGLYLSSPVSINPAFVFLPVMCIVGLAIYTATSTFKKYL